MEKNIESKVLLSAAEKIRQHGTRKEGSHSLEGIELTVSYDGYTVILKDARASITLFFHNKVKAEYQSLSDLESLYQRLTRISSTDFPAA